MSSTRLTINLAKNGMPVTFYYVTGTTCPCTAKRGSYSAQWHIDNPEPNDEDCAGLELIDITETTINLKIVFSDIRALANTASLSSEVRDAIGQLQNVDFIVEGCAKTDGSYFDASSYDEANSYWTIDGIRYVTRRHFKQFGTSFIGDLFLISRKS